MSLLLAVDVHSSACRVLLHVRFCICVAALPLRSPGQLLRVCLHNYIPLEMSCSHVLNGSVLHVAAQLFQRMQDLVLGGGFTAHVNDLTAHNELLQRFVP